MNPTLAQLRKDFTSMRWLMIAWLVLALIGVLDDCTVGALSHAVGGHFLLAYQGGMVLLPLVFVAGPFLDEPLFGRNRQWMVRPPGVAGAFLARALLLLGMIGGVFLASSVGLTLAGSSPLFAIGVAAGATLRTALAWTAVAVLAILAPGAIRYGLALIVALIVLSLELETASLHTGGGPPLDALLMVLVMGTMMAVMVHWRRRWPAVVVLLAALFALPLLFLRSHGRRAAIHSEPARLFVLNHRAQISASRLLGVRQLNARARLDAPTDPALFAGAFISAYVAPDKRWFEPRNVVIAHWPADWVVLSNQTLPKGFTDPSYQTSPYGHGDINKNDLLAWTDLAGTQPLSSSSILWRHPRDLEQAPGPASFRVGEAVRPHTYLVKTRPKIAVSAYAPVVLADLPLGVAGMGGTNDFSLRTWREGDRVLIRLVRRTTLFSRTTALPRPFLRLITDADYVTANEDDDSSDKGFSAAGEWSFQDVWFNLQDQDKQNDWSKLRVQLLVYEYRGAAELEVRK